MILEDHIFFSRFFYRFLGPPVLTVGGHNIDRVGHRSARCGVVWCSAVELQTTENLKGPVVWSKGVYENQGIGLYNQSTVQTTLHVVL